MTTNPRNSNQKKADSAPMRLQRFLAECGLASRRKAEDLIRSGRVSVNGKPARLGMQIVPGKDDVRVGPHRVKALKKGVVLFHKPGGVMSTRRDPHGRKTIAGFLPPEYRSYFPVGRLDFESSGLVVLTNDGELADHLLHPRYESARSYEAKIEGIVRRESLQQLTRGIELDDGPARAQARILKRELHATWVKITLHEGRNRIVRRIFEKLGHKVLFLMRTSHGPFDLADLERGELWEVPEKQYLALRKKILGREPVGEARKGKRKN